MSTCLVTACSGHLTRHVDDAGPHLKCDTCGIEFDFPEPNLNRDALAAALDPEETP